MSTGFAFLDLVIGMIFIFFLLSIITSSAVEVILTAARIRAKMLAKWLRRIFDKEALHPDGTINTGISLGQAIMDHCLTKSLAATNESTTYIKSSDFSTAFLDQITRLAQTDLSAEKADKSYQDPPATLDDCIEKIKKTPVLSEELRRSILALAYEAADAFDAASKSNAPPLVQLKSKIDLFKEKIENWYDSNTERLAGRLKGRWAYPFSALVAVVVTLVLNADTAAMSRYLYDHKEFSKNLADQALATYGQYKERVDKIRNDTTKKDSSSIADLRQAADQLKKDVDSMKIKVPEDFPIGWKKENLNWAEVPKHIPGWLATILAIMLGAPFWFDLLNKIANIRGSGPKPPSSLNDTKGNTTINS